MKKYESCRFVDLLRSKPIVEYQVKFGLQEGEFALLKGEFLLQKGKFGLKKGEFGLPRLYFNHFFIFSS